MVFVVLVFGIGYFVLCPFLNPQSPIPNPQSPVLKIFIEENFIKKTFNYKENKKEFNNLNKHNILYSSVYSLPPLENSYFSRELSKEDF